MESRKSRFAPLSLACGPVSWAVAGGLVPRHRSSGAGAPGLLHPHLSLSLGLCLPPSLSVCLSLSLSLSLFLFLSLHLSLSVPPPLSIFLGSGSVSHPFSHKPTGLVTAVAHRGHRERTPSWMKGAGMQCGAVCITRGHPAPLLIKP